MIVRHVSLIGILMAVVAGLELTLKPSQPLREKTGENFAILCTIKDNNVDPSSLTITSQPNWYVVDGETEKKISTTGRNRVKYINTYTSQLMITNAKVEDAKQYRCIAQVGAVRLTKDTNVSLYKNIEVIGYQSEQHPVEGETARILCRATSDPKPEISWYRRQSTGDLEANELPIDNRTSPRYSIQDDGQVLVIEDFQTETDNGLYKCDVNLIEAGTFKDFNITVTGFVKPRIVETGPETKEFHEGSSAELTCTASGVPAPEFKWYKADSQLNAGDEYEFPVPGVLKIIQTTPDDAGDYKCEALNKVGQATEILTVTIFLQPRIVEIENITARKDEPAQIVCSFSGGEPLAASWSFKGQPIAEQTPSEDLDAAGLTEQNQYVVLNEEKKTITLHIRKTTVEDSGDYTCRVSNKAGDLAKVVSLRIEHPPILLEHSPEKIRAIDATPVELYCTVDALPLASWTWTDSSRSGVQPTDRLAVAISEDQKKSTLKISTAGGHYGLYKCKAENYHGVVESPFEIIKIEPPNKPELVLQGKHPIKARLQLSNYGQDSVQENQRPTKVEIKYVTENLYSADMRWDDIEPSTFLPYDPSAIYDLIKLQPRTKYYLAARGENEAGKSDWTVENYETSQPERPDPPVFTTANNSECLASSCSVDWTTPLDGGSSLTGYVIMYGVFDKTTSPVDGDGASGPQDAWVKESVGEEARKVELKALAPKTTYRVRVYAKNSVGESLPSPDLYISTREFGLQDMMSGGVNAGAIVAIVVIVVLIIVLLVDVACYYVNQCGLLMCVCVNCCGKTPPEVKAKEVDFEQGKAVPEDKKPLRDTEDGKGDHSEQTPMIASEKPVHVKKDTPV